TLVFHLSKQASSKTRRPNRSTHCQRGMPSPFCFHTARNYMKLTKKQTSISFWQDRKSTRLNSSHVKISYAVFCLKKKKKPSTDVQISSQKDNSPKNILTCRKSLLATCIA